MTGSTIKAFLLGAALCLSSQAASAQTDEFMTSDLSAAGPGTVGTLTIDTGGLSTEMWAGSNPDRIKFLLSKLSPDEASPASLTLMRKIMLTEAQLPKGADDKDGIAIFSERVRILFEAGDVLGLEGLIARLSQTAPEIFPGYVRIRLGQVLLMEGLEAACAAPARQARAPEYGPVWVGKINAVCANVGEVGPDGDVQLELVKELAADDALFLGLMARLRGESEEPVEIPKDATLDPLHLALLFQTGQPIDVTQVAQVTPDALTGLARSERLPVLIRAVAGEYAVERGLLQANQIALIYNQLLLQADAGEVVLQEGTPGYATLARAREFATIVRIEEPLSRNSALIGVLRQARVDNALGLVAKMFADQIVRLRPDPNAIPDSALIIKALILAGKFEAATAWHDALVEEARGGPGAALTQLYKVWPLLVVSGPDLHSQGASVLAEDWYNYALKTFGDAGIDKAIAVFSLAEALGEPIDGAAWDRVIAARAATRVDANLPSLSIWRGVAEAGQAGRQAEAGLMALLMLDGGQVGAAHPVVVSAILGAFLEADMGMDARALARDAIMALGL